MLLSSPSTPRPPPPALAHRSSTLPSRFSLETRDGTPKSSRVATIESDARHPILSPAPRDQSRASPDPELGLLSLLFVISLAFRKLAASVDKLSKVVSEELPGTLSLLKMSGLEISDFNLPIEQPKARKIRKATWKES
ncbi:uncharacterized protein LOC113463224 [Phoenix dactylifera]|uniref:Uncharacterized protein LOC113463224 n=1 Tax=Phoenix dactylifera TaxID=42345 RepID=A0A8B8J930_PHODC|nr:uncharacterized protein LOC113463224 [Phoenix dactylifera]